MTCEQARNLLALGVGGDLAGSQSTRVDMHLAGCRDCQQVHERLQNNQSLLRSLRRETVSGAALAEMRAGLFSHLEKGPAVMSWHLRLERFLFSEFRRPRFAIAVVAILAIVSLSTVAQMRRVAADLDTTAAVFDTSDRLLRPEAYREWIFVGSSNGQDVFQNVYMNPGSYREYVRTGKFPEGTVMVREGVKAEKKIVGNMEGAYEKEFVSLQVSVKDSNRFDEGWGFFEFKDGEGQMAEKAKVRPENSRCATCHRDSAATDHVFTQFYPVLRSTSGVL